MKEKLSNTEFRAMQVFMKLIDTVHPHVPAQAETFGIEPGMTVVDYGCGPGRYTVEFARLAGPEGKVYAVDLLEAALRETQKRLQEHNLKNVELKLAKGYDSEVARETADLICAIDMFHHVADTNSFLKELARIAKPDGFLLLSGGHQTRSSIIKAVAASGLWDIAEETKGFLKYKKRLQREG